jgi:hypothetical protein
MTAFPDGFAYLTGAMDQEELLLFALAKALRPTAKQDVNQGVVLGVLDVPSLHRFAADRFGQPPMGLGDGPGLSSNRLSRGC